MRQGCASHLESFHLWSSLLVAPTTRHISIPGSWSAWIAPCSSTSAFVGWCARGLQQVGTQGLYFSSLVLTLSDTHLRAVEGGREYSTTVPALPESWGSSLMAVTWLTWTHWLTVVSGQYLGVSFYISMQCGDTSPNEWKYGILFAAEEVVRAGVLSYAPVSESEHVSLFHPS